jgi:dTMP kinase
MKNKLIVFEGIDGVGKSTIIRELKRRLTLRGIKAICYEEVEDKKRGFNKIKSFIRRKVPIESSLLFYLASSVYKSALISRLLKNSWVLCDRYVYSTLAYHRVNGVSRRLISRWADVPLKKPDFLFLLTVK